MKIAIIVTLIFLGMALLIFFNDLCCWIGGHVWTGWYGFHHAERDCTRCGKKEYS